uniref:G protein-coupled receptor 179 n=1 Tax=Suricata suricatta TaxID=37032 RepID=A0A673V4T6_SURSU
MGTRAMVMPHPVWGLLGCCFFCSWARGDPRPLRSLPPLSSQVKLGSVPMWVPPEVAEAALAFLYSGDAQQLSGANCTERYEAHSAGARPGLPPVLWRAAGTLAQAANFLNMLLQANDIRESSVEEDVEWYQALVRSMAEGDPRAYRAFLTFSPPPGASHLQLALQATRRGEETILQDLSGSRVQVESPTGAPDTSALQKRVLTNDLGSLGSPKWPQADGYVGDMQHVKPSPPFLECQDGRLRPGWLITLSATFYGLKPDLRAQVQPAGGTWTLHLFPYKYLSCLSSPQCVPLESQGFVLGHYLCRCRPGFYGASHSGGLEESATQPTGQFGSPQGSSGRLLRCQPCAEGCTSCVDASPCLVEAALALRAAVLACQACCMLAVFLSMLASYRCRRSKRIRASGVVLLETILFGSLLLYFPVFILYFKPSVFRCIVLRWVRLLGFATVYGTIILKLYRVLQLFLSRTAQRGPHLSNERLLRRLGLLLLLVLGFLAMWTVGALEQGIHTPLVTRGHTLAGRHFYLCHHDRWDYIMVVAEMLLLCWGSFLCYATRAVPSAFHEPRYLGIALHNELLFSAAFHAARFVLVPSLHPDWTLLLFFFHTHSTVTTTLALIFIPKFQKPGAPSREEIVDEVYEDELDLQRSASYLDSSIASAWSEPSLDPGDIRDELKKLYAQLEVHKTKEMAANNPHLPKKRGSSRQGLGRSFIRYLAEFPEALAHQHSRDSGSPSLGSLPGSRHRLLSCSLQDPEGPPALRKSRSTYDHDRHSHRREQGPPLLDSLLRRKLAKKASQESKESRESAEGPPALGLRSASAHNLTVGERLPRARPTSLQKSLSVVAGSREKALLVASQAYLEETYRQAKEREERKKAEAASASPVRRPERAQRVPLSAPPSPAKSHSVDSSHTVTATAARLPEEAEKRLPHPPIRHQVSTPIMALSGACCGEQRMLSPTSTLAPALMPAPSPAPAPTQLPTLTLVPVPPQSPSLLTFICPWENAELPVKKGNVAKEGSSAPEQGIHPTAPARGRLWRALSVALERKGLEESGMATEDGRLQREASEGDEDKSKVFSKSHSLKTPVQQCSMYSLGLAIKALTRSRSTHREKESGEGSPELEEKGRALGEGVGACPRSPSLGRPKAVSKQAALTPCDYEETLQNQQNAHTSRMLQIYHQEGSSEQEDRGRGASQGLGEGKVETADKAESATLRQARQDTVGDKNAERAKEAPVGWREAPKAGVQPAGSADCRVAELCPREVIQLETCQSAGSTKAQICHWEVSERAPEKGTQRQDLEDSQEKRRASERSGPPNLAVAARKKPERLVRGQEAVCPWEGADPESLCPWSASQDSGLRSEAAGRREVKEVGRPQQGAPSPGACSPDPAKAELCPWEACEGENGKPFQEGVKLSQETPKKATFWKEQKRSGDLESFCWWERTDFRGPLAVSTPAPGTPVCSGSLGSSILEVCRWEEGDPPIRKAEVCPRELGDEVVGKEMLSQGTGGEFLQEKGKASRKGLFEEMGEQTGKAVQKTSQEQESVCPQESTARGHPSLCLDSSSAKAKGQFLSNGGSRATQVCPQEDPRPELTDVTPSRAKLSPWEVNERVREDWTSGRAAKAGESQKDKEKMLGTSGIKDDVAWAEPEGQIQKPEAVCPWEIVNPGSFSPQPGPRDTDRAKANFHMSGSEGSKTAKICPWDREESMRAEKAEVCPWEVSAGTGQERALGTEAIRKFPNDTGKASAGRGPSEIAVTAPKTLERPAWEREAACSWESLDPGGSSQYSDTLGTDGPKAGLQEQDRAGCRAAEVCPWEMQEASPSEKAKICPWEVNEGATGTRLEHARASDSAGQEEKTLDKGRLASLGEDISKWDTKQSQEEEAICPWEKDLREPSAQCPEVSDSSLSTRGNVAEGYSLEARDEAVEEGDLRKDAKMGSLPECRTPEKAPSPKAGEFTTEDGGKASKELQSICPQEGPAPAGAFSHPDGGCCDQPKAGSQDLVSSGGRLAEVCPWGALKPDSSAKAEICPWEVTGRVSDEGTARQDGKGTSQEEKGKAPGRQEPQVVAVQEKPERADGKQEAVCPQESQGCGDLPPQPAPQTSDRGQGSSEAADSVAARAAEMCPWEAEESPSAKTADICPWEVKTEAAEKGGLEQEEDRKSQGQGERIPQKAASWEGTEEHFSKAAAKVGREQETVCSGLGDAPDTDQPPVSPHGASSMAELCRWEITDPEGNKIKGTMADICDWEGTGVPMEESGLLASTATRTEVFFPTVPENPPGLSVHRPLGRFLPESKSPRPGGSKKATTFTLEDVRELQGASGHRPRTSSAPEPSLQGAEAQESSSLTEDKDVTSIAPHEQFSPPTVYPWDCE